MFSPQTRWRIVSALALAVAAGMVWCGAQWPGLWSDSWVSAVIYWGLFLLVLAVSLYIVVLDIHFIRLQYVLAKRELYKQTLGEENFRKALIEAQEKRTTNSHSE